MAKFRMIHTEFWDDPKVVEEMTPEDKYFFLYLLTNSNTTQVGIYQITKKQMAFDTGYSMESINSLLDRFINHHKIVIYNPNTREIALKNWGRYNFNRGGKPVIDCVISELKQVKDKSLIPFVGGRVEKKEIKKIYDSYNESQQETQKQQESLNINGSYDTYHDTPTISGQEKEEEKEEEEYKEKEEEVEEEPVTTTTTPDGIAFYQNNFGVISAHIADEMVNWINDLGEEMVIEALSRALDRNKPNWGYAKSILQSWVKKNIKTIDQAKAEEVAFQNQQANRRSYQPKQKEVVPEWFANRNKQSNKVPNEPEATEEEMEAILAKYRTKTERTVN